MACRLQKYGTALLLLTLARAESEISESDNLSGNGLGRMLKGSTGRGSTGGSSCTGDECPSWYFGISIVAGVLAVAYLIYFAYKRIDKCRKRRKPDYVEPPKTDAEMA